MVSLELVSGRKAWNAMTIDDNESPTVPSDFPEPKWVPTRTEYAEALENIRSYCYDKNLTDVSKLNGIRNELRDVQIT